MLHPLARGVAAPRLPELLKAAARTRRLGLPEYMVRGCRRCLREPRRPAARILLGLKP
mgnify:CR=1 FL=1